MSQITKKVEKNLYESLLATQSLVIGLFIIRKAPGNEYLPVIERSEDGSGNLILISVGTLLGLSTKYIHESQGRLVMFPEGKSLLGMMEDPLFFHNWYKENIV